jgi:hypothetical protein
MLSAHQCLEYGSHVHVLLPCLHFTEGAVVEFGCGFYSTSLLSLYSQSRYCRSIEANRQWYEKVKNFYTTNIPLMENRGHEILCTEYQDAVIDDRDWGLAFIDHDPIELRVETAERLRKQCRLVVVHDTERDGLNKVLANFKYHYDLRTIHPHTSVGSETDDLTWLVEYLKIYES